MNGGNCRFFCGSRDRQTEVLTMDHTHTHTHTLVTEVTIVRQRCDRQTEVLTMVRAYNGQRCFQWSLGERRLLKGSIQTQLRRYYAAIEALYFTHTHTHTCTHAQTQVSLPLFSLDIFLFSFPCLLILEGGVVMVQKLWRQSTGWFGDMVPYTGGQHQRLNHGPLDTNKKQRSLRHPPINVLVQGKMVRNRLT